MITFFKRILILVIAFAFLLLFFSFSTLWYFSIDLPDYKKLAKYEPPVLSRVYSKKGELLAEFATEKRLFIPFEAIPEKVIYSFLSAEDKNFFSHPGIDAKSITRAIIKNVKNYLKTKRLEGASTITQQVAKNFLLTNEVSLKRKIKEAILAFRIEKAYTKNRIIELYLNQIYLGQGVYGIAAASLEYFDKSVNELTYEEAALLAALPKAPSKYNPYKNLKIAKVRRNFVLKNLFENSYITEDNYKTLIKKEVKVKKRQIKLFKEANYYSEEVRRIIAKKYGFNKLYGGGLSIKTPLSSQHQVNLLKSLREGLESYDKRHGWRGPITNKIHDKNWINNLSEYKIDKSLNWKIAKVKEVNDFLIKLQTQDKEIGLIEFKNVSWTRSKSFKEILKEGDLIYVKKIKKNKWNLKQIPKINGAAIVMDPFTGRVLAMVGGFSFELSEFNRVTQAYRQPGSAFKPFVYATALENGLTPSTLILDAPFVVGQGEGKKNWKPQNYGKKFYGPSTLRTGIEKSRNLMTVRVAQLVGLDKLTDNAKKFGIYEDIPEVLSISLGSAETTLLNLTNAYCSFINGGKKVQPIFIDRIQDRRGKTIYNSDKRICLGCEEISYLKEDVPKIKGNLKQVISNETAYQMTSMLEGVVKRGTGRKLRSLNIPLAGKTGTTNDNMDAWFIGFTSNLAIGVYVGFDEPKTLGKYETGAKAALPVFKKFVEKSIKRGEALPFKIPETINLVIVDHETGRPTEVVNKKTMYESFKSKNVSHDSIENSKNINTVGTHRTNINKKILTIY